MLNFTFGDGTWQIVFQVQPNTSISVTHAYSTPSFYLAYLDATDGSNLAPTEGPLPIQVVKPEFNLSLVAGWNLISVPLVNHGYMASMLDLTMGDMVVGWNTTSRAYDQIFIFGVSPPTSDFAIEGSTGYWIHTSAAKTFVIYGNVPTETQTRTITVPANGGWAFIGFSSLQSIGHASDIPAMYSGDISLIFRFNSIAQVWGLYLPGVPMSDFPLVPGEGYLIWCTSGMLSYPP